MPMLHIHLDGEGSLKGLAEEASSLIHVTDDMHVAALEGGISSGKPSVCFGFLLPDGRGVMAETSLALFLLAADALRARYGDPRNA